LKRHLDNTVNLNTTPL